MNLGGGTVPAAPPVGDVPDLAQAFEKAKGDADRAMAEFQFHRALASYWEFIGAVNRFVDTTQPWALARQPDRKAALDAALYTLAESLRLLGIVLPPFLPDAVAKIRAGLGQTGEPSLALLGSLR